MLSTLRQKSHKYSHERIVITYKMSDVKILHHIPMSLIDNVSYYPKLLIKILNNIKTNTHKI